MYSPDYLKWVSNNVQRQVNALRTSQSCYLYFFDHPDYGILYDITQDLKSIPLDVDILLKSDVKTVSDIKLQLDIAFKKFNTNIHEGGFIKKFSEITKGMKTQILDKHSQRFKEDTYKK